MALKLNMTEQPSELGKEMEERKKEEKNELIYQVH